MHQDLNRDTENYCKALARELHALRLAKGFSQTALASKAKLCQSFIGLIERAERTPTVATLYRLSIPLEMPPEKILANTRMRMETKAVADEDPPYDRK